tara:strand:- start:21 stop:218 length:198 start_codon:yes stop_codon:yes gene_type:complete
MFIKLTVIKILVLNPVPWRAMDVMPITFTSISTGLRYPRVNAALIGKVYSIALRLCPLAHYGDIT